MGGPALAADRQTESLGECLRAHAAERPRDPWLTFVRPGADDETVSFGGMFEDASGAARTLGERGVRPGEIVAIVQRTSRELMTSVLGAFLAGAVPSVFPVPSAKVSRERYLEMIEGMARHAQPRCLMVEPAARSILAGAEGLPAMIASDELSRGGAPDAPAMRAPEDVALLQHSSGTTGLQKGVMLSHGAVLAQVAAYGEAIRASRDDVFVSWLPLYHDMGLVTALLVPLVLGARSILMDPFDWVAAPEMLFQAITRHGGTLCWLPNFAFQLCATSLTDRRLAGVSLASMRQFVNCSEPMQADAHDAFRRRFAPFGLRDGALGCSYAMAETVFALAEAGVSGPAAIDRIDRRIFAQERRAVPADSGDALRMLSVGRPLAGVELKAVDEARAPVGPRIVGELAVRAPFLFGGYYRRPETSAEAFDGEGFYYTGDLGYTDGDQWYVCGRKKDLIIVGGRNIYPQDLEHVVSDVPGVVPGRCVAFGLFDDAAGTERVVVLAESDLAHEERPGLIERILEELDERLALAPSDVRILERRTLLKSTSGKISRSMNRELYVDRLRRAERG
jgi:acyl-CoA synthetase (AMP-forming)/AMP-acid ligase II